MHSEKITIVFACDDNYARHLGVVLASLIFNFNKNKIADIIIFDAGISLENKSHINNIGTDLISINFISIDTSIFNDYPMTISHISVATYFRLKLPSLLPNYKKVIYLDVDMIVHDDLSEMWDIDIGDHALGAVIEPEMSLVKKEYLKSIGMNNGDNYYINAGSLIMNLDKLRKIEFENNVIDYLNIYKSAIMYQDQDILNGLLYSDIFYIPPKFNFMPVYKNITSRKKRWILSKLPYSSNEILKLKHSAAIYHYCGKRKAWMFTCSHFGAHLYQKYQSKTYWKGLSYTDISSISTMKYISSFMKRIKIRIKELI